MRRAPKAGEKGYKTAKDRNFVFAQMMKIEKMEREIEKKNKEQKMEIKNKDIEEIIMKTKQEIKMEEEQLEMASHLEQPTVVVEEPRHKIMMPQPNFDVNKIYYD